MLMAMTRRAYIADGIGDRIRRLRKERGWTQTALAERVGSTKRSIVYYESDAKYPPAPVLAAIAGAFNMTIDALMHPDEPVCRLKRDEPDLLNNPEDRRLWRRLQQIKALPERDKRAVLRMLDTMGEATNKET